MKTVVLGLLALMVAGVFLGVAVKPVRSVVAQNDLRADVNLVSVYFTVRDKRDRLVSDLPKESFKVVEDGTPQEIRFFAHHSDLPMNVGVLMDTSTGLARTLGLEADAASNFFRTVMRPNDQGFAVSYASRISVLQVPTDDVDRLATRAQDIRKNARFFDNEMPRPTSTPQSVQLPGGLPSTFPIPVPRPTQGPDPASLRVARLYDTVELSVDRFLKQEFGRKVLVIAALADDAGSESNLRNALRTLKEHDVIVYVLEVQHAQRRDGDDCDIRHIFRNEDENRISRLAVETGGRVIRVNGFDRMQQAFEQIADELHHQYSLGYRPVNQKWDGGFRKVSIDAGKGYKISARDGYYAKPRN